MNGLEGRVALVTGATGLLGTAIAKRLGEEGATVAVASRNFAKAKRWVEERIAGLGRYVPVQLDLADESSIQRCLDAICERAGAPSIIVANASLREGGNTPFAGVTHDSFSKLFAIDIAGHVLLMRQNVNRLAGQSAAVVFLSSIYAQAGVDLSIYPDGMSPTPVQYAAVKAGAEGATRWLAAAWGRKGVRVNALVAGGIASPERQTNEFVKQYSEKTMLGRMATVQEIANAAAFLASDEASYITGHCLVVDGGMTAW
jgi:NAD(P)-dependent dehydrogenase (short-subunit alcohol dehydrogenase family)